jgi:hypothetical protein
MDIIKMLVVLRQEREQVEEAITMLKRLARGHGRRRRRPGLDDADQETRASSRQQEQAET